MENQGIELSDISYSARGFMFGDAGPTSRDAIISSYLFTAILVCWNISSGSLEVFLGVSLLDKLDSKSTGRWSSCQVSDLLDD